MNDINDKRLVTPVVQGFTPINKPSKPVPGKRSARLDNEVTSDLPAKKQRKKVPASKPLTTSATTRVKKTSTKNVAAAKSKMKSKVDVLVPSLSALSESSKQGPLSTTTISKLNTFRLNPVPSSTVNAGAVDTSKENSSPKPFHCQDGGEMPVEVHGSQKSDDTLSSDLWRDQEPLPNYPWLYSVYLKQDFPVDRTVSSRDCQPRGSTLLAQFFESDSHVPTARPEDTLMQESELEDLMDGPKESGQGLENRPVSCPRDEFSKACKAAPEDDAFDADEFLVDEHDLDILLGATSSIEPYEALTQLGREMIYPENKIVERQLEELPSQIRSSTATRTTTARDVPQEDFDIDLDEFQDIIDLLESLPEDSTSKATESWVDQTPSPSKSASTATQTSTPQSIAMGLSPRVKEIDVDIYSRFVRPLHPAALQTPSPVPGLSPTKRVLTCFRIGEAINATSKALRQGSKPFIELYARVLHSARMSSVQTFRIVDLWSSPDRLGIVLDGRWEGWEKASLWQKDGEVFWQDGLQSSATGADGLPVTYARKCRLIGSLGRKTDGHYMLDIMSLWEAAWDDIAFAKGLILGMQGQDDMAV